ncbi:hypothetical protein SLEP1_g2753 [Rubroshorea leprosula]|uniref:Uncharacterized protein n=1 Tax=Rubroshorea leprosula TaxID=152421 RepID=A0AAV5HU16_9ROSI|nr:hypothetical protein SLEP1_g2753 [Rubroshorea leprosula]
MKYEYIHLFVRKPVKRSPITNSGRSRYYLLELNLIHHIFSSRFLSFLVWWDKPMVEYEKVKICLLAYPLSKKIFMPGN